MKRLLMVLAALCVLQGCAQPSPETRQPAAIDSASQQVMSEAKRPFSNMTLRADESELYAMPDGIVAVKMPLIEQATEVKAGEDQADDIYEELPAPHEEAAVSLVHVSTDPAPDKIEPAPARQDERRASEAANPKTDPQEQIAAPVSAPTGAVAVSLNNGIERKSNPKRADVVPAQNPRPAPKAKLQMASRVARADAARTLHRTAAMPGAEKTKKSSKPPREFGASGLRIVGRIDPVVNRHRSEEGLELGRWRGVPEPMLVTYE